MAEKLIDVKQTASGRRPPELQILLVASPRNQTFQETTAPATHCIKAVYGSEVWPVLLAVVGATRASERLLAGPNAGPYLANARSS
jgi:hypothetical protein